MIYKKIFLKNLNDCFKIKNINLFDFMFMGLGNAIETFVDNTLAAAIRFINYLIAKNQNINPFDILFYAKNVFFEMLF